MAVLSHLFVHVRDLERARRFYVDYLGLAVLADSGGYLRLGGGDGFHMGLEERPAGSVGAVGIEIVVRVTDVDAMAARLRAAGIDITEPADQPWGARHAWLHDPDGYRLSIYSPTLPAA
jgi:catechol 2,3-dioxygenase-like lactoylglutathione lyase family enzyme